MGNCKNKRLIGPYLDGQLGECKWLEEHIVECSECLAEYETVQRLSHLAEKADYPPPEGNYWQKFSTRVIARIAARPQPKRYPRFMESLFANKLAVRLVTPLLVAFIAVLAIRVFIPLNDLSTEQIASTDNILPATIEAVIGEQSYLPQPVLINDLVSEQEEIAPAIEPLVQAANVNTGNPVSDNNELALNDVDILVKDYIDKRDLKIIPTRLATLDNGFWAEMSHDYSFRTFDTDNVLKFQIISGSNPSLAPLSSYREATGKFFAPVISNSRNTFEEGIHNRWGYASGDDKYNEERQRHLELEFDLSREK